MIRFFKWIFAGVLLAATALCSAQAAELNAILQQSHPWGRFGQGAWRQVRIVTQSFDADGNPTDTSITDNKTTVVDVTPERVTLQVEVTVEVAGRRFPSQPQIVQQGYAGETLGETTTKALDPEIFSLDGREIRCENHQIEISGVVTREVTTVTFAADREPAILRRKSTVRDAAGTKTMHEMTSEVKALDMSRRILSEDEPSPVYLVRLEQKSDRGTTITWSWHAPDVPGEVVDQSSKKLDEAGRLVRQTTLELVAYGRPLVEEVETQDTFREPARSPRRQKRRAR